MKGRQGSFGVALVCGIALLGGAQALDCQRFQHSPSEGAPLLLEDSPADCLQCQLNCANHDECSEMVWQGTSVLRTALSTFKCAHDPNDSTPHGLCVRHGTAGNGDHAGDSAAITSAVVDTCVQCVHACKTDAHCVTMVWDGTSVQRDALDTHPCTDTNPPEGIALETAPEQIVLETVPQQIVEGNNITEGSPVEAMGKVGANPKCPGYSDAKSKCNHEIGGGYSYPLISHANDCTYSTTFKPDPKTYYQDECSACIIYCRNRHDCDRGDAAQNFCKMFVFTDPAGGKGAFFGRHNADSKGVNKGTNHWLVMPEQTVTGLEAFNILKTNPVDMIWDAGYFMGAQKFGGLMNPVNNYVLSLNGISHRSQHQMHMHVAEISDQARKAFMAATIKHDNKWYQVPGFSKPVFARFFPSKAMTTPSVVKPFETLMAYAKSRGIDWRTAGMVVVPSHQKDGATGWYLASVDGNTEENFAKSH